MVTYCGSVPVSCLYYVLGPGLNLGTADCIQGSIPHSRQVVSGAGQIGTACSVGAAMGGGGDMA